MTSSFPRFLEIYNLLNAPQMHQFITLKSGCRINAADIIQYAQHFQKPEKLWIEVRSTVEGENEKLEDMTAEQLDSLLYPPQSPIVSPVIDLDRLKTNAACQFTYEGQVKYGVIEEIGYSGSLGDSFIGLRSDGERYTLWTSDGDVQRD